MFALHLFFNEEKNLFDGQDKKPVRRTSLRTFSMVSDYLFGDIVSGRTRRVVGEILRVRVFVKISGSVETGKNGSSQTND